MTFKEQEQITKKSLEEQIIELINSDGEDLMTKILRAGIQQLMELERDEYIGLDCYESNEDRRDYRNGYKPRTLYTRVGPLVLRVPQTRDGQFYPSILERYQRSEKALVLALAEAYLQGVSTRKMKMITEVLMGKEFSHTFISRFTTNLDAELDAWWDRTLDGSSKDRDIYICFRKEDSSWTKPVNLGKEVNTIYNESCPSISPDGKYLFFSRYDEAGGLPNIYWVSSEVIKRLEPE